MIRMKKRIVSCAVVMLMLISMLAVQTEGQSVTIDNTYTRASNQLDSGDGQCYFDNMSDADKRAFEDAMEAKLYGAKVTVVDDDAPEARVQKRYKADINTYYASSYWNQFASRYYYNNMNSYQKALYDALYAKCMNLLDGTADVSGYIGAVTFSGMDADIAVEVGFIFCCSNPQFYFLNDNFSVSNNTLNLGVYSDFNNGSSRATYTNNFKKQLTNVINKMTRTSSADEAVALASEQVAYNNVCDTVDYNTRASYNQSSYSAIINKQSVCAGYSEAFELYCTYAGIDCVVVTSDGHEWNQVKLGDYWYVVDATFGDTGGDKPAYFNVNEAAVNDGNHVVESFWTRYNRPSCPYNYGSAPASAIYNGVNYAAVYDYNYYVTYNRDVYNAFGGNKQLTLEHFVVCGMNEGRQAKASFNVKSYKNTYKDLRQTFGNDLKSYYIHYINFGKREGRIAIGNENKVVNPVTVYNGVDYSAVYDYNYYIAKYADLKNTFGTDDISTLQHFIVCGMNEGRQAKESFNVKSYKNTYKDLRQAFGGDLKSYYIHYVNCGRREGRIATGNENRVMNPETVYNGVDYSSVYDYNYYISKYSDLRNAFGTDDVSTLQHFVVCGMNEGRQAKETFDVHSYKNKYSDLYQNFGDNLKMYYIHYIYCGKEEGRQGS